MGSYGSEEIIIFQNNLSLQLKTVRFSFLEMFT